MHTSPEDVDSYRSRGRESPPNLEVDRCRVFDRFDDDSTFENMCGNLRRAFDREPARAMLSFPIAAPPEHAKFEIFTPLETASTSPCSGLIQIGESFCIPAGVYTVGAVAEVLNKMFLVLTDQGENRFCVVVGRKRENGACSCMDWDKIEAL